jgi:hypothetical protein
MREGIILRLARSRPQAVARSTPLKIQRCVRSNNLGALLVFRLPRSLFARELERDTINLAGRRTPLKAPRSESRAPVRTLILSSLIFMAARRQRRLKRRETAATLAAAVAARRGGLG